MYSSNALGLPLSGCVCAPNLLKRPVLFIHHLKKPKSADPPRQNHSKMTESQGRRAKRQRLRAMESAGIGSSTGFPPRHPPNSLRSLFRKATTKKRCRDLESSSRHPPRPCASGRVDPSLYSLYNTNTKYCTPPLPLPVGSARSVLLLADLRKYNEVMKLCYRKRMRKRSQT